MRSTPSAEAEETLCLRIGRYALRLTGDSSLIGLVPERWMSFRAEEPAGGETITVHLEHTPAAFEAGLPDGWTALEGSAAYVSRGKVLFAMRESGENEVTVSVRKALDSHVRIGSHYGVMMALHARSVGLHGVTLLCGDEVVILSAPSGTGKSTLARLLERHCGALVLNGDFALLTPTEEGVIFEPTPFCGSSGRCLNHRVRIDRVVFLSQAKANRWRSLTGREAMAHLLSNAFIPTWDSRMGEAVQENILACASALRVNAYGFAPTREAAEEFLSHLKPNDATHH